MTKVRQTRAATDAGGYAHLHRDSPLAKACADVGAVLVADSDRADIAHAVGRHELARAYGLGICSRVHGFRPDVHQTYSGLWTSLAPADYLAQWISTGLQWADGSTDSRVGSIDEQEAYEAARLAQLDQWAAELVKVGPVWFVDWMQRLIHPPKWQYLVEIGAAQWLGASKPFRHADEWAEKMRRQWTRRAQGIAQVERVVKELEQF